MADTQAELLTRCRAAQAAGMDFPTMWNEVLKRSPLVIGPPVQTIRGGRIQLEMRLMSGGYIAFDSDTSEISSG
jgi:hypothetical protein